MFYNNLCEEARRQHHKDLQREMEHQHVLASLPRTKHRLRWHIAARTSIFLRDLGMKLKKGDWQEADAQ